MSVSAISSSSFSSYSLHNLQSGIQQFQEEFQQLGQDLQSGKLSVAQSDFGALQQYAPQVSSSSQTTSPIAQAFNQLSQDLQSGNISAAQQDYATIQQDFQNHGAQMHHHHHHHGGGGSESNAIAQMFQELGQALQSGNLSAAQQAYGSLQQDLQQFAGVTTGATSSNSSSVSFSA